jgi:hypothetical protein
MILIILLTILLSICSTAILSYISLTVSMGPWIASTVVLAATLLVTLFAHRLTAAARNKTIALITTGATVGGISAVGCGFAFPTIYFLNPELFKGWLAHPWYFISIMAALTFIAGGLGLLLANFFEHRFIVTQQMAFPIGELAYKMIAAQNNMHKAIELALGFCLSFGYSILQKVAALPSLLLIIPAYTYKLFKFPCLFLPLPELPMLWSIGFVTGHVIAIPLAIGLLTKLFITTPAHLCYFSHLKEQDFLLAFASGMVLYGAFLSIVELPKFFINLIKKTRQTSSQDKTLSLEHLSKTDLMMWVFILTGSFIFFSHFGFSFPYQLYLLIFTTVCAYQLMILGGKQGIAPMPRFATFVMLPAMLIFGINAVHLTLLSTFIEVCGGVAVDILFGRKIAHLAELNRSSVQRLQWLGLVVSSCSIGLIFWLLITKLGLGSSALLAQRAQTRALTISFQHFDFFALILGALFGALLKDFKISPLMVLGGLLMRFEWSVILVASGLSTYLVKNKESHYPFWSGIFAANSLWMIIQALFF